MIENLFGLTLLTVLVSFAFGVLAAYLLWGIRYYRVMEVEAKVTEEMRKAKFFTGEQDRLRERLAGMESTS